MGRERARGLRFGRLTATARGDGERGAVLVEAVITAILLFTLLFGIIDFGSVFNDYQSVRQGGRDGLRQAVVATKPAGSWSCPIVGPAPPSVDVQDIVCYTKARVGLDQSRTRVKISICDTARTGCPVPLPSPPFRSGYPVKICVQYSTSSITGLFPFLNNKVLNTEVESLIEQDEPAFTSSYTETPMSSWPASCDSM